MPGNNTPDHLTKNKAPMSDSRCGKTVGEAKAKADLEDEKEEKLPPGGDGATLL